MILAASCTFYGEHPARKLSDATGGEGLERIFWKDVEAGNWTELGRLLASNYVGTTPSGTNDREAALAQYRQWQLKSFSLGDVKTEMNGDTIVVTYSITLNGTAGGGSVGGGTVGSGSVGSQLPSTPQQMMTVWQQQKSGWVAIAHSASQP
jgi:hypothetical protein